jgi:hypothetical protein
MYIPDLDTPEFQAFVTGFFLPFLSGAFGFAISLIKNIIYKVGE